MEVPTILEDLIPVRYSSKFALQGSFLVLKAFGRVRSLSSKTDFAEMNDFRVSVPAVKFKAMQYLSVFFENAERIAGVSLNVPENSLE
jgi:hypothetical protein